MVYAFMTGITGFMGQQFVKEYLERYPDSVIYAVVRNKKGKPVDGREELKKFENYIKQQRLMILNGDVTKKEILEDPEKFSFLENKVTEVWHLAGATNFEESKRAMTFDINVDGTSNILELAKKFKKLNAFYHYSTAYIFHKGNGLVKILETGIPEEKFENTNNPYEESKLISERLVLMSGLPFVVFRPSIVMGHSLTAEAESEKMVYGLMKTYLWLKWRILKHTGYIPDEFKRNRLRINGNPQATKNLITIDDVLEASMRAREAGTTSIAYNLVNPAPTTLGKMHEAIFEVINSDFLRLEPMIKREDMNMWETLIDKANGVFRPYLTQSDPDWDMTNTLRIMKKSEFHEFNHELHLHLYKPHVQKWLAPDGFVGIREAKNTTFQNIM